ncbi:hypothetical protein BCR39DRAFT_122195 [Naematelia encephala]|uniref:Uncharacterized protein n=1 Tax=Naematelia encephala TaxID=71784 RepID=A0A1Y2BIV9_9TREE|nr:hypothetical protein BCR39DRAFT_122195 [Naematelia encephala]
MDENEQPKGNEPDEETEDGWHDERLSGWKDRDNYVYLYEQRETFAWQRRQDHEKQKVIWRLAEKTCLYTEECLRLLHRSALDRNDVSCLAELLLQSACTFRLMCDDTMEKPWRPRLTIVLENPDMRPLNRRERRRIRKFYHSQRHNKRVPAVKEESESEDEETASASTEETHSNRRKRQRSETEDYPSKRR